MNETSLLALFSSLCAMPQEAEWIEFKQNNEDPQMIGERISALSNAAMLIGRSHAYFVWGIEDITHTIIGTTFLPRKAKVGNEELESWLSHHLVPAPDFRFFEFFAEQKRVVLLEIPCASYAPIRWKEVAYIRVGTYTKKLHKHHAKEQALWQKFSHQAFESGIADRGVADDAVLSLLDYDAYYRLTKQSLPVSKSGILDRLVSEKIINENTTKLFDITQFGALLFARRLSDFATLGRKAVRVVDYTGSNRVSGGREYIAQSGYAVAFEPLIAYIGSRLPNNEHITQALRVETQVYPEIAIRELVANAIIHQDLEMQGDSPFIEIFSDRLEITNPGIPLISPLRFIDERAPPRNEGIATFLRRVNICEERGSGIDKVIDAVEKWQLPAPEFSATERHTRINLYAPRTFREMSSKDRTRACYQHVSLMYVFNQPATNASLRKRFSFHDEDYKIVSKIISDTIQEKLIKPYDPENRSRRHARYIPYWG